MRRAILHLGFHKTGTTFLQLAVKRWIEKRHRKSTPIFYSSQHMRSSEWLQTRTTSTQRLRNRIARARPIKIPQSTIGIEKSVDRLSVLDDFDTLRRFFSRDESVLIHSDENSIGDVFGHCGYRPGELWPFYPNGSWLCAVFAAAACEAYNEIHVVLSLRRFDEMAISSLKTAAKSPRPFPPLAKFFSKMSDMPSRCKSMLHDIQTVDFIHGLHLLDYELLRRSPAGYLRSFLGIAGIEGVEVPNLGEKINTSETDDVILARLTQRGVIPQEKKKPSTTVTELFPDGMLTHLAGEYSQLGNELSAISTANGKLRYYV